MTDRCLHTLVEQEGAIACDALCPVCLLSDLAALRAEREQVIGLLREVACCGVEQNDPRIEWDNVQMDRELRQRIQAAAHAALEGKDV